MRKIESLVIKYVGYNNPETQSEVELELLGLETAIAAANQRIAVLKQSLKLQSLMHESAVEETNDKTVEEDAGAKETK